MNENLVKFVKVTNFKNFKPLFESYYPIIFTCTDSKNELNLCVCCKEGPSMEYVVAKPKPEDIVKLLKNEITLRDLLWNYDQVLLTMYFKDEGVFYMPDFNPAHLPKEDSYMFADDGEFDEEIEYYQNFSTGTNI